MKNPKCLSDSEDVSSDDLVLSINVNWSGDVSLKCFNTYLMHPSLKGLFYTIIVPEMHLRLWFTEMHLCTLSE